MSVSNSGSGTAGSNGVGYKNTPKHSRFKPGQSGNLKGRPKGKRASDIDVAGTLSEPVTVEQEGKRVKKQPFEITLRKLVKKAVVEHNLSAVLQVIDTFEKYGVIKPPTVDTGGGVIVAPKGVVVADWLASLDENQLPFKSEEDEDD